MQKSISNLLIITLCVLAATLITACGKGESKKSSTQVAAKVNDAEISMHQINLLMKNAQNVNEKNAPLVRQQILEKLIDQQIIVEKANKENLDRTPDVMMAIEAAKKDILARAYLQKMVANSVKVTDQEVRNYYDEHQALFAKRRIYSLQDIGMEKTPDTDALLKDESIKQKSMQEIADTLKAKGIKFSGGSYTRPAEQIPLDILPKLQNLKEGEMVVLGVGNAIHVIRIIKAQDMPMDITASTPLIRNYFINTRGKQAVEEEMKKFRKEAKVEYMGDFAAQSTVAKPGISDNAVVTKSSGDKSAKDSSIEAGVAGLK
ncbi:MAG: EpsD family peptidyl-prolyl cis-trans isomerase [Methylophilaceae bacterium]